MLSFQFEQTASENKYFLQQRFFEYSYQQGNTAMDHIIKIEAIANQLSDLGNPVSELQQITKVLCSLPPSFLPVIAAWENVEDNKKTMSLLTARLLKAEGLNQIQDLEESPPR